MMQWEATYKDGIKQYQIHPETGEKSGYNDIDRAELMAFSLLRNGEPVVTIDFSQHNDGHKLVWLRRTEVRPGQEPVTMHIVGKKGRFISIVEPSGHVVTVDNFVEGSQWLYAPQSQSES